MKSKTPSATSNNWFGTISDTNTLFTTLTIL